MRTWLLVAGAALAVVGCGNGGSTFIPNASTTRVTVSTSNGMPVQGLTVTLSTGDANGTPTGVIATQVTNAAGQVTFTNLPSSGLLCVSATIGGTSQDECHDPFPQNAQLTF